ncbi:unnamed protein product [Gongylonema pulchrum]|uniref:Yippee domain-containing protein n=1 Tax=Gongylonema pulchrum TaxID=637853 RepID=A0A183D8Z3_9BILA|nr:unnamed protein product [Gongylonema pulchrum]
MNGARLYRSGMSSVLERNIAKKCKRGPSAYGLSFMNITTQRHFIGSMKTNDDKKQYQEILAEVAYYCCTECSEYKVISKNPLFGTKNLLSSISAVQYLTTKYSLASTVTANSTSAVLQMQIIVV